nr:hypothetical protein CFP56_47579 [Quercus suber]
MADKLVWPYSPIGVYTVKSGYRFLCRSQYFEDNDYHPIETNLRKKVWGLQVQPKVRNLFWRAIKDSIPSKVNLKRRMVISQDLCDHYKSSLEDTLHAHWACPLLAPVWTYDPCCNFRVSQPFTTFRDLVKYSIEAGVDLNYFANVVWTIWHRRNALQTSDKPFPILRVLQDARIAQASYARSIPPKPPYRGSLVPQHMGWTPRIITCSRVVASMANNFSLPFSVDAVEAFAAKEALKFAQELGLLAIVLEGDSKHTIDSLMCEDVSLADIGHLIEEAKIGHRASHRRGKDVWMPVRCNRV